MYNSSDVYFAMQGFLLVALVTFFLWIIVLFLSKETRTEQITMSIVGLVMTPLTILLSLTDYRLAIEGGFGSIGIEDFVFAFSVFGIASVLYQVLLGKHMHKLRGGKVGFKNNTVNWIAKLVVVIGIWIVVAMSTAGLFELSLLRSFIVGGVLIGTYIIAERKDLLLNALVSGVMVAVLVFILHLLFVARLFPEPGVCLWDIGIMLRFVFSASPLTELLWAGVVGFAIGPLYEFLRHYRLD